MEHRNRSGSVKRGRSKKRPKKPPLYKKWWFWLIAVLALLLVVLTIVLIKQSNKPKYANADAVVQTFKKDDLAVHGSRKMVAKDFGYAPKATSSAEIFWVDKNHLGSKNHIRVFKLSTRKDFNDLRNYYQRLGKSSALLTSYTAGNTKELILLQGSSEIKHSTFQKYERAINSDIHSSASDSNYQEKQSSSSSIKASSSSRAASSSSSSSSVANTPASNDTSHADNQATQKPTASFSGDQLTTDIGIFKITASKVLNGIDEDKVLAVEFDFTNTTNEEQEPEFDHYATAFQTTDTQNKELNSGSVDVENNPEETREDVMYDKVLPGKTIQGVEIWQLENTNPVTIKMSDTDSHDIGTKVINVQ
ncbi:DUF5067 domain-containing protein [Lactobacillus sp. CC-MHH1034]|uniref:DUF5067 domain-containing protein n=1 Tax=Agrilactobacillus fermenti TaxID=2586909 RepID=UPI001E4A6DCD|nr:DUF5067 domain-containing protein [Agrilactobacillus fermenti]MCD2257386.1 DUF5067 domain-containing protein [Agrilactobacillus fermenti]